MKMHDIHPDKQEAVLLLHPMLASAQMMEILLAEPMGNEYRYLIPDFSGHGDAQDQTYRNARSEALQIAAYLREHQITTIQLAFGASMGGVVLMELFHVERITIQRAFFEGTSFYEHADFLSWCLKHVFLKKHRRAAARPELAVEKIGQLYGDRVKEIMGRQMVAMDEESLCNVVYDCGHVHLPPLTITQQKNCVFAYGEKDGNIRKVRKRLPREYPCTRLVVWPGCSHCTRITEKPEEYAAMLKAFLLTGLFTE